MFVQIMIGEAQDTGGLRQRLDTWVQELAPGATGWLGATAGVSTQGPFCTVVRFESEEAARANSERPEQDAWWKETEPMYSGPVTFLDSSDVTVFGGGGSDDAGFAQLMRARCSDRGRLEELEAEVEGDFRQWRPDFIGGLRVWEPDGTVTAVDYFTSEEEARRGEQSAPPEGLADKFAEWQAILHDPDWYDIPDPWLLSP